MNRPRIGIATFHWGTNYGAALQGFALQTQLARLGADAEFVDYCFAAERRRTAREFWRDLTRKNWVPGLIARAKSAAALRVRRDVRAASAEKGRKFAFFWNDVCRRSPKFATYRELARAESPYDACVAGSDQIWNPNSQKHPFYTLDFVAPEKRIAYAPSFAVSALRPEDREHYRAGLAKFAALSVRESDGVRLANELIPGRAVERVLDPTFFLTANDWRDVAEQRRENAPTFAPIATPSEPFVLCYALRRTAGVLKVARKLNVKKIVTICSRPSDAFEDWRGVVPIWSAGPFDFLELFRRARTVVTDSFHGTAFSTIFRKPFWVVDRDAASSATSMNSRLTSLLDLLDLDARRVADVERFDSAADAIDYRPVEEILAREKERSIAFLRRALEQTIGTLSERVADRRVSTSDDAETTSGDASF